MKKDRAAGFTLIELLVVIAIIAILAAILFPVFAKARQRAQATTCASNLKQFGTAFMMYSDDYEGRLPSPGGNSTYASAWSYDNGTTINSYVSRGMRLKNDAPLIWSCPSEIARAHGKTGDFAPCSYGMNSYLRGSHLDEEYPGSYPNSPSNYESGAMINQIRSVASTILLYESTFYTATTSYGRVPRSGTMPFVMGYSPDGIGAPSGLASGPGYHNAMNEYLWCDGHVSAMRPETVSEFSNGFPGWDEKNRWYARKNRH